MKLFTPKEVKRRTALTDEQIRESRVLDEYIRSSRQTANELREKQDSEKLKLEKEFEGFKNGILQQKSVLLVELRDLESRKEKALEPLDKKWVEVSQKEQELEDKGKEIEKHESVVAEQKELLVEKFSFIDDKEFELGQREEKVVKSEKMVAAEEKRSKESLLELNQKWEDFHIRVASKELELLERERQIFDKDQALNLVSEAQIARETELSALKKQLADRAETLERGFAELRTKQ